MKGHFWGIKQNGDDMWTMPAGSLAWHGSAPKQTAGSWYVMVQLDPETRHLGMSIDNTYGITTDLSQQIYSL